MTYQLVKRKEFPSLLHCYNPYQNQGSYTDYINHILKKRRKIEHFLFRWTSQQIYHKIYIMANIS